MSLGARTSPSPDRLMVHLVVNEVDDEHVAAEWGEHVSADEYDRAGTQARGE